MDTIENPILSLPTTVVPLRRNAPSGVKRLILELGLRYRPTAADQLEPYQAKLAALVADCADIPPNHLERAIREWVTQSPYLPKASDLIGMAQGYVRPPSGAAADLSAIAERYNQSMSGDARARGLQWIGEGGDLRLEGAGGLLPRFGREITASQDEITAYAKAVQASRRA